MGVALCLLVLLWFTSGIAMMYCDFPSVRTADFLERSPALDASAIRLSPAEAWAKLNVDEPVTGVRLNIFAGRPVYRFAAGGEIKRVYADTGEKPGLPSPETMRRVASNWTAQPIAQAAVEPVTEVDQWTIQGGLRNLRPLWKYSWPNGEQVYVSGRNGDVVQYTTRASRWGAYFGPIPHWLYFTPLRRHQQAWSRLVIWTSGAAVFAALMGIVIGLLRYSPAKRYQFAGTPASIPYVGQKRWHMILGLIFGVAAVSWAFSGMLSMDPFPALASDGGGAELSEALRGEFQLSRFAPKDPREALRELSGLEVKQLELISFDSEPLYLATLARNQTRIVPVRGAILNEFDRGRILAAVKRMVEPLAIAQARVIGGYDAYYRDRRRERPLPVLLIQLNDSAHSRYYIDPKTAQVVGAYNSSMWVTRWLYHGLHSLDFPWLYQYRPLWDIVVLSLLLGGTALSVTSLMLAWRVLGIS